MRREGKNALERLSGKVSTSALSFLGYTKFLDRNYFRNSCGLTGIIQEFQAFQTTDALSGIAENFLGRLISGVNALGMAVTIVISAQVHRKFNFGPRFVDVLVFLF